MFTGEAPSGFEAFWQNIVLSYAAPMLQIVLWVAQIAFFIYAMVLLKRYVDHMVGAKGASAAAADSADVPAADSVDIDKFVE